MERNSLSLLIRILCSGSSLIFILLEKFPEEAELTVVLDNQGLLSNVQRGIPVNCMIISIMSTVLSLETSSNIVANVTFSSGPR